MKKIVPVILCLILTISCTDFPEISYEARRSIVYGDVLKDSRDGQEYKTVIIGNQTWMAENLNYKVEEQSICYNGSNPEDLNEYCEKYGRLYYWTAAVDTACPPGWSLPRHEDWEILTAYIGGSLSAEKLKAESGWKEHNNESANGIDGYGFAALPGGFGTSGKEILYVENGLSGLWWTATDSAGSAKAYVRSISSYINKEQIVRVIFDKGTLFSVRCIKD